MTSGPCAAWVMSMTHDRRISLQPAYIIHHWPYRETSVILEAFTPGHGKVGLVARGVRGAKGRWRGLLQPFRPLLLSWCGRSGLATLTEAEPSGSALTLNGDVLLSGFYLNELLQRLLQRDDPQLELFSAYDDALRRLAAITPGPQSSIAVQRVLRQFELNLLQVLGYGMLLEQQAGGGTMIEPDLLYSYEIDSGPMPWRGDSHGVKVHGRTLQALRNGCLEDETSLREAKQLMRRLLQHHLGDKPLHSRELMRQAQHGSTTPNLSVDASTLHLN